MRGPQLYHSDRGVGCLLLDSQSPVQELESKETSVSYSADNTVDCL